eukprot:XP_011681918.1 PREDICTED: RNA pseudouridylate synthase domain-containing protein 1-like [Strongylocentrotus purpuratus]
MRILYKSENFVAVDKHYDVKINSDDPKDTITVATQLAHLHPELVDSSLPHSFRFIHRLDYSTSGALCLALNKKAAANAGKMFKDRRNQRQCSRVTLSLGRRHQLRIHCQSIGHPIVGDYTYSMRKDVSPYRMMLLAHTLHIPIPGEDIDVTAEDVFTQDNDPKWIPYQEDR